MTDTKAYCYFKTRFQAERFRGHLGAAFQSSEPYITDTPYQSRSVIVEVSEHDGSSMGTRIFATLLTMVNLYDGLISDLGAASKPSERGGRPGGAPFSGPLPDGVVDDTNS